MTYVLRILDSLNPQLFNVFACCTILINNDLKRPVLPRTPLMLSDCSHFHQYIPTKAGCQEGNERIAFRAMCKTPRQKLQQLVDCHTCGNASRPLGTKNTLSSHRRGSSVACKSSTLFRQIRQLYVITRLNDRIPCIRPNGPDILFASNFPFRLLALDFLFLAFETPSQPLMPNDRRVPDGRLTIDDV
jgi:hypothetical protein